MARILIAEDDPQAREVIRRICEFQGHQVAESCDAAQALSAFQESRPDLVITDLAMPMGGGHHLMRELRALDGGKSCPVIIVTGYGALIDASDLSQFEPCTVLAKPLDLEPMLEAVQKALKKAA